MRGKITKRAVDALKAAADGLETVLWDSELKGFGVRVPLNCSAEQRLNGTKNPIVRMHQLAQL